MGLWKLFYNNSFGLLLHGCRRPTTETAIELEDLDSTQASEAEEAETFDPGEFPAPDSPHNLSLIPEKALQKLASKLDVENFLALSGTCRLLAEKMADHCQLAFPALLLYVFVDNGQLSYIYNLLTKEGARWIPEHAVRELPFKYDELLVIFKSLGRFELQDVVFAYEKIQDKVQQVKIQTDCNVSNWGATLEEFDHFLRQINCCQYIMSEQHLLPLEMLALRSLASSSICGRFDYLSHDVSRFAHYNPYVYLTAVPVQVVINAICQSNQRLFAICHHIYFYREQASEMLLFEQWLLKNGQDIRRQEDGSLRAMVDSRESGALRPVVHVLCARDRIELRGDFLGAEAVTADFL